MKAIPIGVYRNPSLKGCSNNGISERYDELLLVCDEGYIEIDETNPPENLVKLEKRYLFGEKSYYIRPYKDAPEGYTDYTSGGAYAASSDSRVGRMFETYAALPIHDRTESWAMYNMLSL